MHSTLLRESLADFATAPGATALATWPTLLVIDPDVEMVRALVCHFEKRGFHVAAGGSFAELKAYVHRRKTWTLIIADFHLPDASGGELCEWLREQNCDAPMLVLSGSPHCATLCAGLEYLAKPFPLEKLDAYVRTLRGRSSPS